MHALHGRPYSPGDRPAAGKLFEGEHADGFQQNLDVMFDIVRIILYVTCMIKSFADSRTRQFYESGKESKFRGLDVESAEELLAVLDAAMSLKDISPLKSVGLHKLSGNRAGQWAISANGPWRICFRFKDGDAYDVQITDYHKG